VAFRSSSFARFEADKRVAGTRDIAHSARVGARMQKLARARDLFTNERVRFLCLPVIRDYIAPPRPEESA
jgi:hypothetical protein